MALTTPTVLAMDPSLCGAGLVLFQYIGRKWQISAHKVIRTQSEAKKRKIYKGDDMTRRIRDIIRGVDDWVNKYDPKLIVAELTPGGSKSSSAAAGLAVAKTVTLCIAEIYTIPLDIYAPDDLKKLVGGRKNTPKSEIKDWAAGIYPELVDTYKSTSKPPSKDGWNGQFEHIADAVAVFHLACQGDFIRLLERA